MPCAALRPGDNYVLFRFSGGGADFDKRTLRAEFLSQVLQKLDFEVNKTSGLIYAQVGGVPAPKPHCKNWICSGVF